MFDEDIPELTKTEEARRQIEICNACRYCEGYCSVFPAMFSERMFSDGDVTQLANLCHNCRGCYYACQYTEPHEFAINLPRALAEKRQESWKDLAWPSAFSSLFDRSGVILSAGLVLAVATLFFCVTHFRPASGTGFHTYMSHALMVSIFAPAFLLPLIAIGVSLRRYGTEIGRVTVRWADIWEASMAAGSMKNLKGGHGDGCNFEDEDRFSNKRRLYHQLTLYGFLLCFASTSSGTILHYLLDLKAPYNLISLPKFFGVPGGLMLCFGTAALAVLKCRADTNLGAPSVWGGEMAFVLLLFGVSATGLGLYASTGSVAVPALLAIHLGFVLVFFLTMPYSKMAHGFYRMAALVTDAAKKRTARS
ncbi:MAG: tricarballylate utilization 4Fe-4S protein TcuB [Pseudomonadota bacterium]